MKDKQAKYPQLRFKGFTDPWEKRKLGDLLKEFSIKSKIEDEHKVLSSTNSGMEFREGRVSGTSNLGYKIIKNGDLVLSPQNLWLGNININNIGKGLVSPSYKTFELINIDSSFINPQLRTQKMLEEYKNSSTQGASVVRRNLEIDSFYQIKIFVPTISEQEKIGSFFQQLDNTIVLHQSKLAKLKELKQGYLQKLFPKNGSKFPQLRFAGFADDWEEHKLGDIFDVHTDFVSNGSFQALKENVQLYKTENYAYMIRLQDASNNWNGPWLYTDKQGFDFLDKSTVYKDDILMSDRGTIGKFFLVPQLDKPMTLSSNAVLLRSTKNDNNFIYYMLNTSNISNQIIVRTTPGVQPMISKTEFKKINTCIPNIEEQQKIGSFFKQLDDTIALHQRKLEKLQELKKGYLQKMFC